ncbi:MAG: 4Fe-4S binding protein [Chloroflexota bacterium]
MLEPAERAELLRRFKVPPAGVPHVWAMLNDAEIRLILAAPSVTVASAAAILGRGEDEADVVLAQACRRGTFTRRETEGHVTYEPANFYERLDAFATYDDAWYQIPQAARLALDGWMLEEYLNRVRPNVERLRTGLPAEQSPGNDSVILLNELYPVVEAARTIAVVPCNCRRLGARCALPVETCVSFNEAAEQTLARGRGRRLSQAEAKELLRLLDKKGLMHTADFSDGPESVHNLCNCCADDCYVFRGAVRLESKGVWPRSRYLAEFDAERCNRCGLCVKRCHFGAFVTSGQVGRGRPLPEVTYDASHCWGCGLCANTCPTGAIRMKPTAPEG